MADELKEQATKKPSPMKKYLMYFTFFVVVVTAGIFIYWYFYGRFEDSTDDAYVHGNIVNISPQISGIVSSIHTDNMRFVKQGQILVQLDTTDYEIALEAAKDELARVTRDVARLFEKVHELKSDLEAKKIALVKAQIDYENRRNLVDEGAVSKEDYIHSKLKYEQAFAFVQSAKSLLKQTYILIRNTTVPTHPWVRDAASKVKDAFVNLNRCTIYSPSNGIVSKRIVQVGSTVSPTDTMLSIVPLDQIWVQANFREVDVSKLRIGQRVRAISDMYGSSVVYHGFVSGIDGGTGAVFSLIPPQNATGNWIKIVQRIPVRIDLDSSQVSTYPLRIGASMEVTVDTHDQHGPRIPDYKGDTPVYCTDVYDAQELGADSLIQSIIEKNMHAKELVVEEIEVYLEQ